MIVDNVPNLKQIASEVWKPLLGLFVWDVIVTIAYFVLPFHAPSLPLTLFGSALALFLGFRVNSSYARWWEGRSLWGSMINASRSLAREACAFLPGEEPERRDLRRSLVLRQIAYVHSLRSQLRRHPVEPEVLRFLSQDEAAIPLDRTNTANALLHGSGLRVGRAVREGLIDTIQQRSMEATMVDIANAQGGMERLKNTPLPVQYRFLPDLFTRLFCMALPIGLVESLGIYTPLGSTAAGLMFLAILSIGDDLVDPFADTVHDVPLSAMCRTIEIDLLQCIGEPAPDPIKPVRGVLW